MMERASKKFIYKHYDEYEDNDFINEIDNAITKAIDQIDEEQQKALNRKIAV